jgi:hypothetical protein
MRKVLQGIVLWAAAAALAQAHFVFVVPQTGDTGARIFISETLQPDPAVDAGLVSGSKLSLRDAAGKDAALTLVKAGDVYAVRVSGSGTRVIHGLTDIGVSGTAEKPYWLLYYPKTILGDAFDKKTVLGAAVPTELIPVGKAGALRLQLLGRGKPVADAEVMVLLPDGHEKPLKTDKDGLTEVLTQTGRYGAWARFWETHAGGEREGKKYTETHHYATLVADVNDPTLAAHSSLFATLPQATASFGAVASDGWLYVYGGHVSPTHNYFVGAVSGRFDRLRLTGEPVWEELPGGPAAQGLNLTVYKGKILRVGGMTPRNEKGTPSDNISIADAARFDPSTKKWEALPSLPEPRSSHDLVVIGDQLFVTGGWNMTGRDKDNEWAKTTLVLDLAAKTPAWSSIPQPFERRALMAAALDGKMYVIGGINAKEAVETTVSIYDPKTKAWTNGPKLPEGENLGFAPATGVHQGSLYVSVADGSLLRLNKAGTLWEKAGITTPRLAHRLASRGDSVLVIGGANDGKNSDLIEAVAIQK